MHYNQRSFEINFNMDILSGCKWKCAGCQIDRKTTFTFERRNRSNFKKLVDSIADSAYSPSIFILGPTDIYTARNSRDILRDPEIGAMLLNFRRLALNSTFIEIFEDITNLISENFHQLEIEFRIILDINKIHEQGYLKHVSDNYHKVKAQLRNKKVVCHPQVNIFDTSSEILRQRMIDYTELNDLAYKYFGQGVDYAYSFSRIPNLKTKKLVNVINLLKEGFQQHVTFESVARGVHFDSSNLQDLNELILSYREGELFYAPGLYDEYVNFEPEYRIPMENWSVEEIIEFKQNVLLNGYRYAENLPCENCQYLNKCIDKGSLYLMEKNNIAECIFPISSLDAVNGVNTFQG